MVMEQLQKSSLAYDSPEATELLLTDEKIAPELAPLFKDVYSVVSKDSKFSERDDFFLPKEFQPTFDQVHEMTKLEHLKLMTQDQIQKFVDGTKGLNTEMKQTFESDEFMQTLLKLKKEKKLTADGVKYWAMNDLEWKTRFLVWHAAGAYPKVILDGKPINDTLKFDVIREEELQKIRGEIK